MVAPFAVNESSVGSTPTPGAKMLSNEDRKELLLSIEENQILDSLFEHPGMKIFIRQAQEMHDAANNLNGVNNLEDLHYKRGQIRVFKWFLSWHDMVKTTLVGLVDEAEKAERLNPNKPQSLLF